MEQGQAAVPGVEWPQRQIKSERARAIERDKKSERRERESGTERERAPQAFTPVVPWVERSRVAVGAIPLRTEIMLVPRAAVMAPVETA